MFDDTFNTRANLLQNINCVIYSTQKDLISTCQCYRNRISQKQMYVL